MEANVNPIDLSSIHEKATTILQTAAVAALAIPPPAGPIVAAAIEALQGVLEGAMPVVEYCVQSRLIEPLKLAAPYIDARYQDKLFAGIETQTMDMVIACVKDTAAWKLGKGSNAIGIDSGEVSRTENVVLAIMYDTGMPRWMALGAISEMAWDNNGKAFSRLCFDQACDILGQPRSDRDLGHIMAIGYAKWNGQDDVYGDGASAAPTLPPPPPGFHKLTPDELATANATAIAKTAGGRTPPGVVGYLWDGKAKTYKLNTNFDSRSEEEMAKLADQQKAARIIKAGDIYDLTTIQHLQGRGMLSAEQAKAAAASAMATEGGSESSYMQKDAGIPMWAKAAAGVAVVAVAVAIVRK